MNSPPVPSDALSDVNEIIDSTELPTLETLQRVIWASPNLICAAEKKYAVAKENSIKNDKMLKSVFAVIFNALPEMSIERAKNMAYDDTRYKIHIASLARSVSGEIHAQAELNVARNRFRAAEILTSVEQTVMRLTSR